MSTENSLLAKWSVSKGLTGISLSSSSTENVGRKRKTDVSTASESALLSSKKSNLIGDLSSGLLKKYDTGSSYGSSTQKSSLMGGTRSLMSDRGSSGLMSSSTLTRGLLSSSSNKSSLTRDPLTSSLSSKSTLDAGLKRPISQVSSSSAGSSVASYKSNLQKTSSTHLSSLSGGSSLLNKSSFLSTMQEKASAGLQSLGLSSNVSSGLLRSLSNTSSNDKEAKTKKSKSQDKKRGKKRARHSKHETDPPSYDLSSVVSVKKEIEVPNFIPPDRDRTLMSVTRIHDVNGIKFALVNAVSGSLICQPDFCKSSDPTRVALVVMAEKVIYYDPEFVLKVALYTRKQLNIRTTANFLLALASHIPACRPYLKKYFKSSIALPSDWIEVAEIYSAFPDKTLPLGSLPSALRKAMIAKFPDFDKYQLAKYNKESSKKKKKKKLKKAEEAVEPSGRGGGRGGRGSRGARGGTRGAPRGRGRGAARGGASLSVRKPFDSDSSSSGSEMDSDEEREKDRQNRLEKGLDTVLFDEGDEDIQKMSFTLKQLVRKLHIVEPVEHVMCLIGKKYPSTLEEFYRSRLPGTFEEERAGKRMKLPVPETWETQVSLKGNKATTWQDLLDHKKLPFMAMLRNLRNLIKAGISPKHHNMVLRRLTDEKSVINSKQFPFRFFSAYEVLDQLLKDYDQAQAAIVREAVISSSQPDESTSVRGGATSRGRGRGRGSGMKLTADNWWIVKKQKRDEKKKKPKETPFDTNLLNRYKKALDTSVKLATVYNVSPIRGTTVILCDVGSNMNTPCTAARGLGKPRTMLEVSILLGLMCKYSCEDCIFYAFSMDRLMYTTVELDKGTILDNMSTVMSSVQNGENAKYVEFEGGLPMSLLYEKLRDRVQIDNLLVFTGGLHAEDRKLLSSFMDLYRRLVNPDLLYVNVSFAGKGCGFSSEIKPEHDNNIYISGFSDQILRFIAERGDGGPLRHVENIDEAFNLKSTHTVKAEKPSILNLSVEKPLEIPLLTPCWRTARVFISSTFRDMHGERDLLTRFIFPELRALGLKHFINIYEVDLRWGVTEEETKNSKTLELCLSEISRSQFFIGMLGERYGWVPNKYEVPDTAEYEWVRKYPAGASVTELEMQAAALNNNKLSEMKDRAFFFLRDSKFEKDVPKVYKEEFLSENSTSAEKMKLLKDRIRHSGLEVFDNYPCTWGGIVDGKCIVSGLEEFGTRSLNNLWNGIQKLFPDEDAMLDEASHTSKLHDAYVERCKKVFVGRNKQKKECLKIINDMKSGVIALVGKTGTGKSSLLASVIYDYQASPSCHNGLTLLTHFVGAAPGSTNIVATLRRLSHELNSRFNLQMDIPEDFKNLVAKFEDLLKESSRCCSSPLVIFIDGIDNMDSAYLPHTLDWLPQTIPENVVFVITCLKQGKYHESLMRRKVSEITVEGLDMWDKSEVVKSHLAVHSKSLDESPFNNQMKILVSKKEANVPLYLSLACEELRVYGLFDRMTAKLKSLPHTVPHLLQEVMSRIESDLGVNVVSTALTLLVCVRDGLEQIELLDLLTLDKIIGDERPNVKEILNIRPNPENCLPSTVFSQLQRSLQGFLNNPLDSWTSRLCLSHSDIIQAIKQRYIKQSGSTDLEVYLHRLLAGYFYSLADPDRDGSWKGKSLRAFKELPYHLMKSSSYTELKEVICSLQFIRSKCMLGLASDLIEDYQPLETNNKLLEREQARFFDEKIIKEYKSFVSRNLHVLSSHPALTWQQAYNEKSTSHPAEDVRSILASECTDSRQKCMMEWTSKPINIDPCYLTISNLPQAMTSVSVSTDNKYFVCGGLDCIVHMYDLQTGKEIRSFRGHADAITDVCFVGKDKICSVSKDSSVSVWDVNGGHSPVNCVSFHPEGQKIVSGQWDSTIKIWDIFHKTKLGVLRGHGTSVRDIAYSPSGRHIASAALDGDVKMWAADLGVQVGNILGHALPINKLTFSPTGNELITVSDDHKVKVWSGHLGKPLSVIGDSDLGPAVSVAISPLKEYIAIGYHSGLVRIHDVISGALLASSSSIHKASIRCIKFITRNILITGSGDPSAKILDINLKVLLTLTQATKSIMSIDVSPEYLALASEDCSCYLYENPLKYIESYSGEKLIVKLLGVFVGHTGPVTCCCFDKTGSKIVTGSRDMSIRIWDIVGYMLDDSTPPLHIIHNAHNDWITDCKLSNNGPDRLITSSNDFNLKVWDISKIGTTPGETQKDSTGPNKCTVKHNLKGHMAAINHIAFNNGCIVSTCADGSVKVWANKGVEITTLYGHTQRANGCDMLVKIRNEDLKETESMDWSNEDSNDSSSSNNTSQPKLEDVLLATCGDDGTVRLWSPLQANELASLTGHSDKVLSVASNNQGHVCTTSLDNSIKLWSCDQDANKLIDQHNAPVTFVSSRMIDGSSYVLTGSRDGKIKIWRMCNNMSLPTCLLTLPVHTKAVTCGAWMGIDTIITGSEDCSICLWKLKIKENNTASLERMKQHKTVSPIISLDTNNEYIVVSEWQGFVTIWSTSKKIHQWQSPCNNTNWLLKVRCVGSSLVYLSSMDGQLFSLNIVKQKKNKVELQELDTYAVSGPTSDDIPESKQQDNWVLDVIPSRYCTTLCVDSSGQITQGYDRFTKEKIHSAEVTCVVSNDQNIFTGSRDKTIKVWDHSMKQVGQFFCMSPVTSMSILEAPSSTGTPIVYGDELGFINFLMWKTK
ncbi:hypothetical protein ACF0H5_009714 [Mactra antiquata]